MIKIKIDDNGKIMAQVVFDGRDLYPDYIEISDEVDFEKYYYDNGVKLREVPNIIFEDPFIRNIPTPSKLTIMNSTYDVIDSEVELDLTAIGEQIITIVPENPMYLPVRLECKR